MRTSICILSYSQGYDSRQCTIRIVIIALTATLQGNKGTLEK